MIDIQIWSDGSCNWKTKEGGLGLYIKIGEEERYFNKGFSNTTVGRMELLGLFYSMHLVKDKSSQVLITSDSQYVINTFNKEWIFEWERTGFYGRTNADIMKMLFEEYNQFKKENVKFAWVKGHSGVLENEIADQLAKEAFYQTEGKIIDLLNHETKIGKLTKEYIL